MTLLKSDNRIYCFVDSDGLPMSKWPGFALTRFPCIAVSLKKIKLVKGKSRALHKYNELSVKYPKHYKKWKMVRYDEKKILSAIEEIRLKK